MHNCINSLVLTSKIIAIVSKILVILLSTIPLLKNNLLLSVIEVSVLSKNKFCPW